MTGTALVLGGGRSVLGQSGSGSGGVGRGGMVPSYQPTVGDLANAINGATGGSSAPFMDQPQSGGGGILGSLLNMLGYAQNVTIIGRGGVIDENAGVLSSGVLAATSAMAAGPLDTGVGSYNPSAPFDSQAWCLPSNWNNPPWDDNPLEPPESSPFGETGGSLSQLTSFPGLAVGSFFDALWQAGQAGPKSAAVQGACNMYWLVRCLAREFVRFMPVGNGNVSVDVSADLVPLTNAVSSLVAAVSAAEQAASRIEAEVVSCSVGAGWGSGFMSDWVGGTVGSLTAELAGILSVPTAGIASGFASWAGALAAGSGDVVSLLAALKAQIGVPLVDCASDIRNACLVALADGTHLALGQLLAQCYVTIGGTRYNLLAQCYVNDDLGVPHTLGDALHGAIYKSQADGHYYRAFPTLCSVKVTPPGTKSNYGNS